MTARIPFDPDEVDVTAEAEYQAIVNYPGPVNRTLWAADERTAMAKRFAMLEVDQRIADEWEVAMVKLINRGPALSDAEFTATRMELLKRRDKERKRLQAHIHYNFGPGRRKPRLVERETRELEERLRTRGAELRARLGAILERRPYLAPTPPKTALPQAESVDLEPAPSPRQPDPDPRREIVLGLIEAETGILDPDNATDDELHDAYASRSRVPPDAAQWFIDELRGRPHPEAD